ncbi:hypothetical protein L596_024396 [Steinernema carpocapsae]|uniref:Plus3 domain-containing protein n=1 Tax=Steinernema carpocapsae TaxID=34508 RepID=A0A4U5MGM0_STECR|nr:hypothetical protein L596_024396 [Steinernema carpocapsae]
MKGEIRALSDGELSSSEDESGSLPCYKQKFQDVRYRSDFTIDDADRSRLEAMCQLDREKEYDRRMRDHEIMEILRKRKQKKQATNHNEQEVKNGVTWNDGKKPVVKTEPEVKQEKSDNHANGPPPVKKSRVVVDEDGDQDDPMTDDGAALVVTDVFGISSDDDGMLSSSSCSSASSSRSPSPSSSQHRVADKTQLELAFLRDKDLGEYCHLPFFKDYAVGAFVRVTDGEGYKIYQIIKVREQDPNNEDDPDIYKIGNTRTNAQLRVKCGKEIKNITMDKVSDSHITDEEFAAWKKAAKYDEDGYPHLTDVEEKIAALKQLRNRVFTENDVSYMLRRKALFRKIEGPHSETKKQLYREIKDAMALGDMDKAVSCKAKLHAIDRDTEGLLKGLAPALPPRKRRAVDVKFLSSKKLLVESVAEVKLRVERERRARAIFDTLMARWNPAYDPKIPDGPPAIKFSDSYNKRPIYMFADEELDGELGRLLVRLGCAD